MSEGIDISMPGARDLIQELRALNEDVARKTVRRVIREAGVYILNRLKANTPVFTGKLRFNLDVTTKWKSRSGILQAKVSVATKGKADDPKNAFYWRFVERGFTVGKKNQRRIEGQEFVQKTQSEIQQPVATMFFRALEQAISRRQKRG